MTASELSPMDVLEYYSRDDVAAAMADAAQGREVGGRFRDGGFSKRPDVIMYPGDLRAMARRGVTSFHYSVERWSEPTMLRPGMSKAELDALRTGWDLLLDIDPKRFDLGKVLAEGFVELLLKRGLRHVDVKFSGNKGWHIAVPYESFAGVGAHGGAPLASWFPEAVKAIGEYLKHELARDSDFGLRQRFESRLTPEEYRSLSGRLVFAWDDVPGSDEPRFRDFLSRGVCSELRLEKAPIERSHDGRALRVELGGRWARLELDADGTTATLRTSLAGDVWRRYAVKREAGRLSLYDDSQRLWDRDHPLDPFAVVEVDSLLMTSRHMIRMPYSLHEKSWLVSVPLEYRKDAISRFHTEDAAPERVRTGVQFLAGDRGPDDAAARLFVEAVEWFERTRAAERPRPRSVPGEPGAVFVAGSGGMPSADRGVPSEPVPPEHFPPCIAACLAGMHDGKKRMEFVLEGFLRRSGWAWGPVEALLLEWDARNTPPLGEAFVRQHVRYGMARERDVLPPNCRGTTLYRELGLCRPDAICKGIKNPISYPRISLAREEQRDGRRRGKAHVREAEAGPARGEGQAPTEA